MGTSAVGPDAELFYGLYSGVVRPQLVRMAINLGLFAQLAKEPLDIASLARATSLSSQGIERLADYLVAIGLLSRSGKRYCLTESAKVFLVPASKAYAGDLLLGFTNEGFWDSLMNSLRSGKPKALLERFDQDAWVESYRTARITSSLEMWKSAGIPTHGRTPLRVLDLACGCGIKSLSLAKEESSVRVTCIDRPEVLVVAEDLAERMGLADRVSFVPADLHSVELGEGIYEACLAGQITHYLTEAENRHLFRRIHRALTHDGRFVIDVPLSGGSANEGTAFLSLVLWANSGGTAYDFETYDRLLKASGFGQVARLGERWIVAGA